MSEPLFSPRMTPVCNPALAQRLRHPEDLYKVPLLAGHLVAPFALEVPKPLGWYFVCRQGAERQPGLAEFRAWVRQEARVRARRTGA